MRRLVNNWLYGEVSSLLTGRLDTDIYAAGCSRLENMYVHRQGGISRRPPLKKIRTTFSNIRAEAEPKRLIPFTISSGQSFIIYMIPYKNDSLKMSMGIDNGTTLSTINATPFQSTSWGLLTENELREIRYAVYYDCLYLVHRNCPLLRIRYTGSGFVAELPQVKVNQDVVRRYIKLSLNSYVLGNSGAIDITVNGETHSVVRTSITSLDDIYTEIGNLSFEGWTLTKENDGVIFKADEEIDKYIAWTLPPANATRATDVSKCDFKITSLFNFEFSYTFSSIEDEDDTGLVYGQDDFLTMQLNTQYNYASNIAIASERMWLVVNGNPCRVFVSRPYGTSQVIYPKDSNDTILDFIQFEIVATTTKVMKSELELPVKPATDSNGSQLYVGTAQNQRLWAYDNAQAKNELKTKQDYDYAVETKECTVVMASLPDYELEGEQPYRRISSVTAKDSSFTITYSYDEHVSSDYTATKVNTSKLITFKDLNGVYQQYSKKYLYYDSEDGLYYYAYADDSGSEGLKYSYVKTQDPWPSAGKTYFTGMSEATAVATPDPTQMNTYYERSVVFNPNVTVYEKNLIYKDGDSHIMVVEFNDVNGMAITFSYNGTLYCSALPYYTYDLSTDSEVYEDTTEVDKVATSSTGMDLQFSTGKNDYITWIGLGDSIMVGTESSEHRMDYSINPLEQKQDKYSDFGSTNGLVTNVGRDLIFLQKGNKLRLLYKDNWGLQNLEVTLTNPDIMEGEILNMVGIQEPEPALVILKRVIKEIDEQDNIVYEYSIVYVSLDRTNGIQAFSRWTFSSDIYDICVQEVNGTQRLVVIEYVDSRYVSAYFDFSEKTTFADCGKKGLAFLDSVHSYVSIMRALPFDSQTQDGSITLGEAKNVSKIIFRCLDTGKVNTWYNEKDRNLSRTPICCDKDGNYIGGLADFSINVNGGTTRDLMIAVESHENEPMTLLAMAYELRVNRNGY